MGFATTASWLMTPTKLSTVGCILQTILWISLGSVLAANLRYFVAQQVGKLTTAFPHGTLIINFSGSFVLGFFLIWTTDRVLVDPRWGQQAR